MLLIRNSPKSPIRDLDEYSTNCATFLFTRFNVPIPEYRQRLADEGIAFSDWLKSKRDAFLNYCLPSVLSQSRKDFVWMIGLGERTPEVEELVEACASYEFIRPIFLTGGGRKLVDAIRSAYQEIAPADHVLTARLDCDDALNQHFIYNLHIAASDAIERGTAFAERRALALCFPFGAKLSGAEWCPTMWQQNPFLAVLEPSNKPLLTVFARAHGRIFEVADCQDIATLQPMWLQVVDQDNVMNRIERREGPIMPVSDQFLDMFAIRAAGERKS